jgi:hypothetical protein
VYLISRETCVRESAGRSHQLEHKPKKIKAQIFPYDDVKIEPLLATLVTSAFVQGYKYFPPNTSGPEIHFYQITNFKKHQRPHYNEIPSIYKDIIKLATKVTSTCDQGSKHLFLNDDIRNDDIRNEEEHEATESQNLIIFKCEFFEILEQLHKKMSVSYSGIDILSEYKKMDAWLEVNPAKRKKSYPKFINSWLARTAEKKKKEEPIVDDHYCPDL